MVAVIAWLRALFDPTTTYREYRVGGVTYTEAYPCRTCGFTDCCIDKEWRCPYDPNNTHLYIGLWLTSPPEQGPHTP